jgi:hypothetical protein
MQNQKTCREKSDYAGNLPHQAFTPSPNRVRKNPSRCDKENCGLPRG